MRRRTRPRARRGYIRLVGFGEPVRVPLTYWQRNATQIDPAHLEFKCSGCARWRPFAFGGAPDPECDECWLKNHAAAA